MKVFKKPTIIYFKTGEKGADIFKGQRLNNDNHDILIEPAPETSRITSTAKT